MASDRSTPRKHSTPQSIPLQDLSRPPDPYSDSGDRDKHRRSVSGRARDALLGQRHSFNGRVNTTGRYERVAEGSPTAQDRNRLDLPHITTPRNAHQAPYPYEDGELSPVNLEDQANFQAAMGSMGLSFDPAGPSTFSDPPAFSDSTDISGPSKSPMSIDLSSSKRPHLDIITEGDGISPFAQPTTTMSNESEGYFSPTDNDRTPLADERYREPISGAQASTPSSNRHNRLSVHGGRLNERSSPGSRLGDDLPNTEAGLRGSNSHHVRRMSSYSTKSATRSLSVSGTASSLSRAGTMVRKMSQRVVNLSNEPEVLEQSIRRQPSSKHARLEGPPSFPAFDEYAHDEPIEHTSPIEKSSVVVLDDEARTEYHRLPSPLKGKSLLIFPPDSWIRLWLCELLVHPITEPVVFVLIVFQTILLAIESAPVMAYGQRPRMWGSSPIEYVLLALFAVYTLEIGAKVIVSGFIKNAEEYTTVDNGLGFKDALFEKWRNLFTPQRQQTGKKNISPTGPGPSILRSFTSMQMQVDQSGNTRQQQRIRLARRAFLRHSFNRLDFLAVVSFWISFGLSLADIDSRRHVYIFQMLSSLRILRLLNLTSGTSVILRSLKKAAPLLVNVAFLIGFFWLLFAIIGVQIFKRSFRRTCVWFEDINEIHNPNNVNYTQNLAPENVQFCGGYINATTGSAWPWLTSDLKNGTSTHKGYLCPANSLCIAGENPYGGTVSFDNVPQSLQLVFVIMSSNTFSDLLYYTTDSDYLAAALFFSFGIVIMSLWLMNLLVAVITSSFQVIREESKASAFTVDDQPLILDDEEKPKKVSLLKWAYDQTYWLWIVIIIFDLVVQGLRSSKMGPSRQRFIDNTETVVTIVLVMEIFLRFVVDWRHFHMSRRNWVDLSLAVITAIIQIPAIRQLEQPYAWLTFFQIVRIYRVVLAVSLTRDLIMIVLGNVTGLLNLIVFVFLITFLVAIFAVQIFRGQFPAVDASQNTVHITFTDIYNSFIGIYQVLSSENWTILMYNATQYDLQWSTAWIGATFFILWFILANFIVLNMFIAVIQENFDVTEDEKRLQQVKAFLVQKELGGSSHGNLSLSAIFRLGRDTGRPKDPLDYGPATMEMLLNDATVRDFLDEQLEPLDESQAAGSTTNGRPAGLVQPGVLSAMWGKVFGMVQNREPNPFYSRMAFSRAYAELDPRTMARQVVTATEQRKRAQRQYLSKHPTYNVSLFLFSPSNPIRRLCQRIVGPGRGNQRFEGVDPLKPVWYSFSAFIYAAIVAMVLLACVTTPLYQREYFHAQRPNVRNWFIWTDMGFAIVFTIEAMIKVIADGFFWTPNAYFRGSWGFIDGLVLVTLWINVVTSLNSDGGVSRAVGAFKALRALRLLNVSNSARDTFHSVIVLGGWKVLSAAFVSLSLLIPFAIYGLNLFNGQMQQCNDQNSSIANLTDCVGEYMSTPYNWDVLAPRQVANPYYSFDDFGSSLFILFQIVSQEGWTDVMWTAMGASGRGQQLQPYASQGNALFFIVFNLLGAVFVLTLFVSVFMRNYTEQTGVAYLTAEQRSWLELRKLLRQISPSKRPSNRSNQRWRAWCYRIAVKKHGKWQRFMTTILVLHLILLVMEFYPEYPVWEHLRDFIFLAFTLVYIANIGIRVFGLTWKRFRKSSWDLYSIASVAGTLVTSLLALSDYGHSNYGQLHKLFLVSIALLLIPRNNQLDQLFKTAAASLTVIGNLLATWCVLFLVFAIALTQTFGLTRFGPNENGNLNFRNVPKALILLFRMSCGEGWNQIMEDFATINYPNCVVSHDFYESDCGSSTWARALFISWNILSMYIFVSMFVSLIFESFSYVYQRSSGLSAISREEIRRFKQAWATFDPEGSGYISKEAFPRLLGELSGAFEMRIYDGEHSVYRILEDCTVDTRGSDVPAGVVHGIDLARLNKRLGTIDVHEIRRRRARLDLFSQEVLVSADADRGINFTTCLMILAHYNVISDNKSLKLEEFLRRRARLQLVEEEVRRRVVIGFFDTMFWSRRFRHRLDLRHSAHMMTVPQFAVPEIFVDDQDATTPFPSDQSVSPTKNPFGRSSDMQSLPRLDTGLRHRGDSTGASPSRSDGSYSVSPHVSRRPSLSEGYDPWGLDGTLEAADVQNGGRSRQNSSVDRQNVLDVFDNSAWGESIRRSFTTRRPGTRGRGAGHEQR